MVKKTFQDVTALTAFMQDIYGREQIHLDSLNCRIVCDAYVFSIDEDNDITHCIVGIIVAFIMPFMFMKTFWFI